MPRLLVRDQALQSACSGTEFDLDADASKKLSRVLRLCAGDTFVAFDGLGHEWQCVISEDQTGCNRGHALRAAVIAELPPQAPSRLQLGVAQAIPKGDRMEWVLQKGTELGVAEFWPFESQRTVARLDMDGLSGRAAARGERWRRITAQAAAQCGRADVPIVHAVTDFGSVVGSGTSTGRCLMLDECPEAERLRQVLRLGAAGCDQDASVRIMLLVGPEGGWTDEEREWAQRYGAEPVSLGTHILRTETAALVAAAILAWEWGDLGQALPLSLGRAS